MNTILWIHGFPLASSIFEKQLAMRGVRHLMFDLPGFGQSPFRSAGVSPADVAASRAATRAGARDAPASAGVGAGAPNAMSMDDYARVAIEELDARGIEKAVVAGLSMGGYVAFAAWRLFRARIAGLILLDTRETADTDEGRKGRLDMIETVRARGVQPVVDSMLLKMLTSSAPQEMKDRVREIMMSSSPEGVTAALQAMAARPDSSPLLASIDVPTLIIVGEDDAITPVKDAERMHAAIASSRLVKVPRAAHLACFERAEVVNEAIATWCSGSAP